MSFKFRYGLGLLWAAAFFTLLHASEENIAAMIIDKTVDSLFKNEKVSTWGETSDHVRIIRESERMVLTADPSDARLLIVSKKIPENISKSSIVLTTEYALMKKDDRIIGAFFWQKGRPNLLFLRDRLEKANIKLKPEFNKYIEDEL